MADNNGGGSSAAVVAIFVIFGHPLTHTPN
jgi:hypothetical protein